MPETHFQQPSIHLRCLGEKIGVSKNILLETLNYKVLSNCGDNRRQLENQPLDNDAKKTKKYSFTQDAEASFHFDDDENVSFSAKRVKSLFDIPETKLRSGIELDKISHSKNLYSTNLNSKKFPPKTVPLTNYDCIEPRSSSSLYFNHHHRPLEQTDSSCFSSNQPNHTFNYPDINYKHPDNNYKHPDNTYKNPYNFSPGFMNVNNNSTENVNNIINSTGPSTSTIVTSNRNVFPNNHSSGNNNKSRKCWNDICSSSLSATSTEHRRSMSPPNKYQNQNTVNFNPQPMSNKNNCGSPIFGTNHITSVRGPAFTSGTPSRTPSPNEPFLKSDPAFVETEKNYNTYFCDDGCVGENLTGGRKKVNLIVNYIPDDFTEKKLFDLFCQFGPIKCLSIIKDPKKAFKSKGYGFVKFAKQIYAETALETLNGKIIGKKRLKVAFALERKNRSDANLFVSRLPVRWTSVVLQQVFEPFGFIIECKILRDRLTGASKRCGFVRFEDEYSAQRAVQMLHNRVTTVGNSTNTVRLRVKIANAQEYQSVKTAKKRHGRQSDAKGQIHSRNGK